MMMMMMMMMIEDVRKDITNSFKEIQENTSKQVKELNKTIENLKMERETIQNFTKRDNPGDRKPRKDIESHRYRIQQLGERIYSVQDTRENIDITVKENAKC